MTLLNEHLLDEQMTVLETMRTWSPRVISKLETLIRTGDDYSLFRINPIQYASERGMSETEAIDLFLHATKIGLFEMEWNLLCPACGNVVDSFSALTRLHTHAACISCAINVEVALDDFIQVTFTISLRIRDNIFRYPDSLSAEDYFFRYFRSKDISRLPNKTNTTLLLTHVQPGQAVRVEANLAPGVLQLRDYTKSPLITFLIGDQPGDEQHVLVHVVDGQYRAISHPVSTTEVQSGIFNHVIPQAGFLGHGVTTLEIENLMDEATPLWINNFVPDDDMQAIQLRPFVSGKKLLTTQTFRNLFRSEVIHTDEGIGVQDITFLFTDLKGSTAMYDQVGDAKAYFLVRQHFETLNRVVAQNSGAVVKTIGDAVMATFMNPADAVKAAVEMLRDIDEFNQGITEDLILKIGIHRGHSIVVTLNDRLDYFGQTVNIASRVQGLADAGEIYITDEAFDYPGVNAIVEQYECVPMQADVKGVRSQLKVHKIAAR
jgi:class 3 adenylate cyclase